MLTKEVVKKLYSPLGFKKTSPDQTISSLFSQIQSAHDAIFVFENKKFLGIVNLYHSFLQKRLQAKEKVTSCIYHPPKINFSTSLSEVARLMIESRVYLLPVFDYKNNFAGAIDSKTILKECLQLPFLSLPVNRLFSPKKPIYINFKEGIGKARSLMMENKVNRLLVVDNNKIIGILSSYDLRKPFSTPTEPIHFMSRSPIKKEMTNTPVRKYFKNNIFHLKETDPLRQVIQLIINNDIGSVLIFKKEGNTPFRLISTRDILKIIFNRLNKEKIVLNKTTFKKPFDNYDNRDKKYWIGLFRKLISRNKLLNQKLVDAKIVFETKSGKNRFNPLLEVKASVKTTKNQIIHIQVFGRNTTSLIRQVIKKIQNKLRS